MCNLCHTCHNAQCWMWVSLQVGCLCGDGADLDRDGAYQHIDHSNRTLMKEKAHLSWRSRVLHVTRTPSIVHSVLDIIILCLVIDPMILDIELVLCRSSSQLVDWHKYTHLTHFFILGVGL